MLYTTPPPHMPDHKSDTEKHGDTKKTEKLELGGPLSGLCFELEIVIQKCPPCIAGTTCRPCNDIRKIYEDFCR